MLISNSPLRYPGGKTSLSDFLASVILCNTVEGSIYVEPYCGGAGAALNLLYAEYVDSILLNDADRCIYAFWKSILNSTENFIKLIIKTPVTLREWNKQQSIYKNHRKHSLFEIGFATFYLNRCNRSGILMKAGPIGGKKQTGEWKIDARYNKKNLIKRIQRIALYKDRIKVYNLDAITFLKKILGSAASKQYFIYLDPPYYEKGSELYLNYYQHEDHKKLALFLKKKHKFKWLMSYDNVQQIRDLYKGFKTIGFNVYYSANKTKIGNELLIYNESIEMPPELAGLRVAS